MSILRSMFIKHKITFNIKTELNFNTMLKNSNSIQIFKLYKQLSVRSFINLCIINLSFPPMEYKVIILFCLFNLYFFMIYTLNHD